MFDSRRMPELDSAFTDQRITIEFFLKDLLLGLKPFNIPAFVRKKANDQPVEQMGCTYSLGWGALPEIINILSDS